jgi:hypothetical protein
MLAVTQYNDEPINDSAFRRGYLIRERSLEIGLTKENTAQFKYTKLWNNVHPDVKWYWDPFRFMVHISNTTRNDHGWMISKGLVDTGRPMMTIDSLQHHLNPDILQNAKKGCYHHALLRHR